MALTTTAAVQEVVLPDETVYTKQDMESTPPGPTPEPGKTMATSPQFPEGGLQGWLTVVGGYAHSPRAKHST